jgi:predicted NAD/FAD-binding protein
MGSLIRFCHNHGLLQVTDRPQWYTVAGGSREYVRQVIRQLPDARRDTPVRALTRLGEHGQGGVVVHTDAGPQTFDEVVLACHSDQALALLGEGAVRAERELLGAIRYHANRAVLHTDETLMPARRKAWAAWNYERSAPGREQGTGVCLHYWINRLQPLPWAQTVVVSLNPLREPRPEHVISEHPYAHPVFDLPAVAAQRRLGEIQGRRHVWFCGAWTGYGFHEDGLKSGLAVAAAILARQRTVEAIDEGAMGQAADGVPLFAESIGTPRHGP